MRDASVEGGSRQQSGAEPSGVQSADMRASVPPSPGVPVTGSETLATQLSGAEQFGAQAPEPSGEAEVSGARVPVTLPDGSTNDRAVVGLVQIQ